MSCCQSLSLTERADAARLRIYCSPDACAREKLAEHAADVAIRCAWLRVHAEDLHPFDPSGQLTAALFDFAHLLEATQREGWFS